MLGLLDLTKIQTLYIHELIKVIIIYKSQNFMLTAFQIVVQGLKNFNNNQKIIILDLIPSFDQNHIFQKIGY